MTETRSAAGAKARLNGARFENEIIHICNILYNTTGLICLQKTPEPVKQLGKMNRDGTFKACYTTTAQPDFKGVINGGRCIVFEAKCSATNSITHNRVTAEQMYMLLDYAYMGAAAYVVIRLQDNTYIIPARSWAKLPIILKRKTFYDKHLKHFKVNSLSDIKAGLIKLQKGVIYG